MQGLVKRILREAYREPSIPPSAGTPLAQSVFAGIPSPSRGPSPCFVTHPNYHNGQFHHYYPSENPIPISQSPTTSAHTTLPQSTGMNASQTSVTSTTSSTSTISTTPSTTVHCSSHTFQTVAREAHKTHTVFAPITLVESLTKTNLCKVLKWGLFRLPAYVVNVMKMFARVSGCNTHLLVGFYCLYVGEA